MHKKTDRNLPSHSPLPTADWKDFCIDTMNHEEDTLLDELHKYYENEAEHPLSREWHPSLLLAYELGYFHKGHSIPDGNAGSEDILNRLSLELFPGNGKDQRSSRTAFVSCASLYLSFLYTLQYFREAFNKPGASQLNGALQYLPFQTDYREMATFKNFITWLASMVGNQIRNPIIDFKNEMAKDGSLGFDGLEEKPLNELEKYFWDISKFWNREKYACALKILAYSITKNAPYIHFYDGFTHGQNYLGKKSLLYMNIETAATRFLEALQRANLIRQEDILSVEWLCSEIDNAPRHGMEYLLSCPCFFAFIHAASVLPYGKRHVNSHYSRPVWGTDQVEHWGWRVLQKSRDMLKNELRKHAKLNIVFEPGLFWMQSPEGYNMAACQAVQ